MPVTFPAQEVKRRGMSVMNESLAHGPVWVISNNTPKYVVISACASSLGDYFTGGVGSVLYVDEFEFIYR